MTVEEASQENDDQRKEKKRHIKFGENKLKKPKFRNKGENKRRYM